LRQLFPHIAFLFLGQHLVSVSRCLRIFSILRLPLLQAWISAIGCRNQTIGDMDATFVTYIIK
jgi:hypothetical protein